MITNSTGLTCSVIVDQPGLGFVSSQPAEPGFAQTGFVIAECLGLAVADSLLEGLGGGTGRSKLRSCPST